MLTTVIGLAEPAAEAEGPSPLAPHLAEIIFALVFLALLWVVFDRVVSPRFEKAYAERTKAIEGGMNEAKQAQAEAKAALDQYNAQLAEARQEAARIREEAREQGAAIIAEMREQAVAESQRIVQHAHTQIEAERTQAVAQLRTEERFLAEIEGAQPVGTDS